VVFLRNPFVPVDDLPVDLGLAVGGREPLDGLPDDLRP